MTYTIAQVICGICTLLGLGQAISKEAKRFDKITGWIVSFIFICFIIFIEEAFK